MVSRNSAISLHIPHDYSIYSPQLLDILLSTSPTIYSLCFRVSRDSWSSTDAKSCGKTSLQHRWLQQHVRLCQSELKIIFDNFTTILLFCLCFVWHVSMIRYPSIPQPIGTSMADTYRWEEEIYKYRNRNIERKLLSLKERFFLFS